MLATPQTASITTTCVPQLSTVPSFVFPNAVSQRGTFKINRKSGLLTWDSPTVIGRYDFAITVQEWRKGVLLSQTQYEQLILAIDKPNTTPGTLPPYEPAQLSGDGLITGVTELENSPDVTISFFPVPTHDQLQVTLNWPQPGPVTVQLVDLAGHTVYEEHQENLAQHYERSIDMRLLPPGVYFLRVVTTGQTVTRKVLKR